MSLKSAVLVGDSVFWATADLQCLCRKENYITPVTACVILIAAEFLLEARNRVTTDALKWLDTIAINFETMLGFIR
jgi:hypothetical protein